MKDFMKSIPELAPNVKSKRNKPRLMAVVDEDNCTGCQVCVPFCPVDCIEPVDKDEKKLRNLVKKYKGSKLFSPL